MLCQNIQNKKPELSLSKACLLVNLSRHAYSNWLKLKPLKKDPLLEPIIAIKKDKDCRKYGYRRVTAELHRQNIPANPNKVLIIMRINDLTVKRKVFRVCTTNSNHNLRKYPNLIQNLAICRLNQLWVSDITYIRLANGTHLFLAVIMDRFSRRFLGWQLSRNMDEQLCLNALEMAFQKRKEIDFTGLIHHSDQGAQYAGNMYVARLKERGILISMSRKGNPYDNAHMESAIKTIKYEEVYMDEYETFNDAYTNIKHFIEEIYNKKRLNSAIGYQPPAEFEEQYALKEVVA